MLDTVTQVELDKDATESLDTTQIQIQTRVKEQDTMCCYTCLNGCIHHQSPRYSCRYYRYRYRQKTGSKTPDTVTQIELAQDSAEALDTAVDINSNQGLVRGYYAPLDVTLVLASCFLSFGRICVYFICNCIQGISGICNQLDTYNSSQCPVVKSQFEYASIAVLRPLMHL